MFISNNSLHMACSALRAFVLIAKLLLVLKPDQDNYIVNSVEVLNTCVCFFPAEMS